MGLTREGLKARILNKDFTLAPQEAIDLFYMYPNNVECVWKDKEIINIKVTNLNVEFKTRE